MSLCEKRCLKACFYLFIFRSEVDKMLKINEERETAVRIQEGV